MAAPDEARSLSLAPAPADFERTPPQDLAAEQSVLGGMLLSKDAVADVVEILRSGDFYRPAHQIIFDLVLDLYGRGEPADAVTVSAALAAAGELGRIGGSPYLHTLISSVPTAANAGYYARIVAERAVLRRLVEAGTRIVQLGYGSALGRDVDDVVDLAQQAVYDVTERRTSEDYIVLEELLQPAMDEIEAISSQGGVMSGVPTGFADLDRLLNGLHPGQLVIVAGRPGLGKALALDTPIPTPSGWSTMGELQPGEHVIGADGHPTTVLAATDVMTGHECFRVSFSDGSSVVADADHLWLTDTRASRRRSGAAGPAVRTTREIAATVRCATADGRLNHSIPVAAPLNLPHRADLPVPPYVLGVWLGDGESAGARFVSADPEIAAHVEADGLFVAAQTRVGRAVNYSIRTPPERPPTAKNCVVCERVFVPRIPEVRTCGRSCGGKARFMSSPVPERRCADCGGRVTGWHTRCLSCGNAATVTGRLRGLGVLKNKHIPPDYLRASEAQRRSLLAGLLDTDGTVDPGGGRVSFTVTSERLATDVAELVAGLGYRPMLSRRPVRGRTVASSIAFTVAFATNDEVFRLSRKRRVHEERRRAGGVHSRQRYVTAVEPVPSVPVRCIRVAASDGLFLVGRSMIVTHNSTAGLDFVRSASIKNGLTSVIFSLEMSKIELTMRLLSAEARVPLHNLRSGRMSEDDWMKLARRMGEVSEAPLFIDDSPNMTLMEIRAKARRLKQRHDLRLVLIDYMQLMSSPKRVESRQQEVSELSRGLKLLAKELEVPVIAVSQLNRGPEQRTDKRPQLSDLRESGSIEQDSDVVILLHRDDYYEKESPRAGEADFIVAKHRNGPTDTVTVAFQGHYSRFVDMSTGM